MSLQSFQPSFSMFREAAISLQFLRFACILYLRILASACCIFVLFFCEGLTLDAPLASDSVLKFLYFLTPVWPVVLSCSCAALSMHGLKSYYQFDILALDSHFLGESTCSVFKEGPVDQLVALL